LPCGRSERCVRGTGDAKGKAFVAGLKGEDLSKLMREGIGVMWKVKKKNSHGLVKKNGQKQDGSKSAEWGNSRGT